VQVSFSKTCIDKRNQDMSFDLSVAFNDAGQKDSGTGEQTLHVTVYRGQPSAGQSE
jgi:hypothetical protein